MSEGLYWIDRVAGSIPAGGGKSEIFKSGHGLVLERVILALERVYFPMTQGNFM